MSTKSTIASDDDYLLYEEAFEDDKVYLQLYDCKVLTILTNHYQGNAEQQVTMGIPVNVWKQVVKGWLDFCAKNEPVDIDLNDSYEDLLKKNIKKNQLLSTSHEDG